MIGNYKVFICGKGSSGYSSVVDYYKYDANNIFLYVYKGKKYKFQKSVHYYQYFPEIWIKSNKKSRCNSTEIFYFIRHIFFCLFLDLTLNQEIKSLLSRVLKFSNM